MSIRPGQPQWRRKVSHALSSHHSADLLDADDLKECPVPDVPDTVGVFFVILLA